jgi:hypothetical protein
LRILALLTAPLASSLFVIAFAQIFDAVIVLDAISAAVMVALII